MPACGHVWRMSAIDFFISVRKWAKSLDVFNSLVAKLEAIMSQVMGDHHLGKHDVRVVVIGGDLPVRLSLSLIHI